MDRETCVGILTNNHQRFMQDQNFVGHVHGFRETLRVRTAMANVAMTLMKYTHAYDII